MHGAGAAMLEEQQPGAGQSSYPASRALPHSRDRRRALGPKRRGTPLSRAKRQTAGPAAAGSRRGGGGGRCSRQGDRRQAQQAGTPSADCLIQAPGVKGYCRRQIPKGGVQSKAAARLASSDGCSGASRSCCTNSMSCPAAAALLRATSRARSTWELVGRKRASGTHFTRRRKALPGLSRRSQGQMSRAQLPPHQVASHHGGALGVPRDVHGIVPDAATDV